MWRIGIIGTGNVAWHLAQTLAAAGIPVSGLLVRNVLAAKAKGLQQLFTAPLVDQLPELAQRSDLIIIAINDNHIGEMAANLMDFRGIVCHTSGSVPLSILAGRTGGFGVFYPLQTLTKGLPVPASQIPICIETSDDITSRTLSQLALHAGFPLHFITSEERLMLHVAAVMVCNFTNHLMTRASQLTRSHNLDFGLLKPLIHETIRKALEGDPMMAQTGPALRNDSQTILKHLGLLSQHPEIQAIYGVISESITKLHNHS